MPVDNTVLELQDHEEHLDWQLQESVSVKESVWLDVGKLTRASRAPLKSRGA